MWNSNEAFWVVIPAAGIGARFQSDLPKQYLRLLGKTVLEHSLSLFLNQKWVKGIILALSPDDTEFAKSSYAKESRIQVIKGADIRSQTVENALQHLRMQAKPSDWVLVHDAVRPCLHEEDLRNLVESLLSEEVGGVLGVPATDTLKWVEDETIEKTLNRQQIWQVSTPQMFRLNILLKALTHCREQQLTLTDDAQAIEYYGLKSKMVRAAYPNPKLTYGGDSDYISLLLQQKNEREKVCSG